MIKFFTDFFKDKKEYNIVNKNGRTFLVYRDGVLDYVIKHKNNDNDFFCLPFDGLIICNDGKTIFVNDQFVEVIKVGKELHGAKEASNEEVVSVGEKLYLNNDKIVFYKEQKFLEPIHFIDVLKWTDLSLHYPKDVEKVVSEYYDSIIVEFKNKENCKRGFVHLDLQRPNVLKNHGKLFLIDFETCCYSYSAINVAQGFYNCYIKQKTIEESKIKYKELINCLNDNDKENFKFFIKVISFYWEIRVIPFKQPDHNDRLKELKNFIKFSKSFDGL